MLERLIFMLQFFWFPSFNSKLYRHVAERFKGSRGLVLCFPPEFAASVNYPNCDVSWISDHENEGEVLLVHLNENGIN